MIPPLYESENVYSAIQDIIVYAIMVYALNKEIEFEEAGEALGITVPHNLQRLMEAKALFDKHNKKGIPMTKIDKTRAFEIRNSEISYKENKDEVLALCGELAIKSIIGLKPYCLCYRSLVLARMAGLAKVSDEAQFPEAIKMLSGSGGKRQWRRLIELLKRRGCAIYTPNGGRGFYASYKYTPLGLAKIVEDKLQAAQERRTEQRREHGWGMSSDELRQELKRRGKGGVPL